MPQVILQGHIVVPDEDLQSVLAELPVHIALSNKEEGCLVFQVCQDKENPNTFNVYEEFAHRDAFELHQQRLKRSRWGVLTARVTRHYHIKEVN